MIKTPTLRSLPIARRAAIALFSGAAMLMLTAAAPWSSTVSRNSIGAHVIGNPAAKVTLVEYFSYTCGACGRFATTSDAPLTSDYVNKSLVQVEYRNMVRDPLDMIAALLARCGRASAFHGNHQAIFEAQPHWIGKVQGASEAQQKSWYDGPVDQRAKRIATDSGLFALMQTRGYSEAQLDACLTSESATSAVIGMTNIGQNTDHVRGTPSFFINGKQVVNSVEWSAVKSALDLALKPV